MDHKNLPKQLFIFFLFYNIKLAIGNKGSKETEWQNAETVLLDSLLGNVFDVIQFEKWLNKFTVGILCYKTLEKSETNAKNDDTETIKFGQKLLDDFCQNYKAGQEIEQAAKKLEKQAIELMKKMEADPKVQKLIENAKNDPKLNKIIEKSKNYSNFKKFTNAQLEKIVYLKFSEMANQIKGHGMLYNKQRPKRAADSSPTDQLILDVDLVTNCIILFTFSMIIFHMIHFRGRSQLIFHIIFSVLWKTFLTNCLLFNALPWQNFPKLGMDDDDSHNFIF